GGKEAHPRGWASLSWFTPKSSKGDGLGPGEDGEPVQLVSPGVSSNSVTTAYSRRAGRGSRRPDHFRRRPRRPAGRSKRRSYRSSSWEHRSHRSSSRRGLRNQRVYKPTG